MRTTIRQIFERRETVALMRIGFFDEPQRIAWVYAIQCGEFIKIGFTEKVGARFSSLQGANPHPLRLICYRRVAHWARTEFEATLHEALADHHHRDEWFKLDEATARQALHIGHQEAQRFCTRVGAKWIAEERAREEQGAAE